MNKFYCVFAIVAVVIIVGFNLVYDDDTKPVEAEEVEKIVGSPVYATILNGGVLLDNYQGGNCLEVNVSGARAEILKDRSLQWYYVEALGHRGWIAREYLYIPDDPKTNTNTLSTEEIEKYINAKGLESDTNNLVWVDIDRQRVYILEAENEVWRLEKVFVCATGKNVSPTTRGVFKISDRGEWFYSERLKSGAKNWVRFNESYLFHSVAMDKDKNIVDGALGERRSSGCVRMSVADSGWFFDNIKYGTTVFVN